jgi:hypothetical protein
MIIRVVVLAWLSMILSGAAAFAQERGDFMDFFSGLLQSPAAQQQLQKIIPKELVCIDRELRARGFSLQQMLIRGSIPDDLISEARSTCRDRLSQAGSLSPSQGEPQSLDGSNCGGKSPSLVATAGSQEQLLLC